MAKRGQVTPEIKNLADRLLGVKCITVRELRLMPYVQYVMMNNQKLDPQLINNEDRKIWQDWKSNGWVNGGMQMQRIVISKDFWDAMNEILWLAYVIYEDR